MKAWLKKRWLHVVIGLALVASGPLWASYVVFYAVYLWNVGYSSTITQRTSSTDKFEIFRDLLVILIPIATGLATLAYFIIRAESAQREKRHEEKFEKAMQEHGEYLSAQSEGFLSYTKWREYHSRWMQTTGSGLLSDDSDLKEAIYWAEAAFKRVERLDKKRRAETIINIYNLLAYLLAIRGTGDDRKNAVTYAKHAFENRSRYPHARGTYEETYWWAIFLCSDRSTPEGQTDHGKAVAAIRQLLAQTGYDTEWRATLRQKYKKVGLIQ